jgi:hypothetical protein
LVFLGIVSWLFLIFWFFDSPLHEASAFPMQLPEAVRNGTSASAVAVSALTTDTLFLPLAFSSRTTYTLFLPLVFSNYAPPVRTVFGAQFYGALDAPSNAITLTQETHTYWVRWPISWSAIEPVDTTPDQYNWSAYDASILRAAQTGVHLVATIGSNPGWAATYSGGPIDKVSIGKFTEFIGALAERYDGDGWQDAPGSPVVDYWEFYNEPDNGSTLYAEWGWGYWGHSGALYAQMLCAVYPVIKAANPRAQVALGGLAYDWFEDWGGPFVREFLDDVLTAGGGQCFDAMNFHYYPAFEPIWFSYGPGLTGKVNYLRTKLGQYGLASKPMISTEAGWHSDFESTPEIQSRYVVKLFTQTLAKYLDLMIWFSWIDPGGGSGANGLLTQQLQRKPSFYVYRIAAEKLGSASFQRILSSSELGSTSLEGYLFTSNQRALYVLWSRDEVTRTVAVSLSQARIRDMYGQTIAQINDGDDGQIDGKIQVPVGPNPIYVEAIP